MHQICMRDWIKTSLIFEVNSALAPLSIIYVVQAFSGINSVNMSELKMSELMPEFLS